MRRGGKLRQQTHGPKGGGEANSKTEGGGQRMKLKKVEQCYSKNARAEGVDNIAPVSECWGHGLPFPAPQLRFAALCNAERIFENLSWPSPGQVMPPTPRNCEKSRG